MTIDKTIEAIETLPDDTMLRIELHDSDGAYAAYGYIAGPDLKALAAELKELREFVGAMRPGSAIFTKGGAILCGGDGNWYTDHHGKFDSAIDAYRKMKAGEGE